MSAELYVGYKSRVWKKSGADYWSWKCSKPRCKDGAASHWGIALYYADGHARTHIRSVDEPQEPCCNEPGSHYHCPACDEITGMLGHHVGGPFGRTICDPVERRIFLREIIGKES